MAFQATNARAQREKDAHNEGLKRGTYNSVFAHTRVLYDRKRLELLQGLFRGREDGSFLEIGSASWIAWIANNGVRPKSLTCINISEVELEKGVSSAERSEVKPQFRIMDANALEFADGTFDVVYGGGILHHLDFEKAVDEVYRVLKPGGIMVFQEPLDLNPIGWVVRWATPAARTPDERPLRFKELNYLRSKFDTTFHHEQFTSVPLGVLSRFIFKDADNPLTRTAFALDEKIVRAAPFVGNIYRHVLVVGRKSAH